MAIHPTAVIESGAQLGKDVTIGAFSYIDQDVQIGDGCIIGPHVTILRYTDLGIGCQVHAGAVLGDLPQDLAFKDAKSYIKIGANSVMREGVTIHRGTKPETVTEIGADCLLMAFSHVAHNAKLGDRVILANGALVAGYAEVGERAFISGNCLVHQFTRVGRLAMMSGGSAVQKDVPPFCITRSMSPNTVIGLNVIGMRRAGMSSEERLTLKRAMKILYQSNLNVSEAVEKLEQEVTSDLVLEVCQFIKSSKRGICKFVKKSKADSEQEEES
ncbi:MAG: acyl-ACP--UDP-N-acetylglucosamine O-acyltransferase [Leptolyngbyaceae bacterium]|nr:acyl-ACP--UDP-N-acetylglucosamine O-acyltransferase [Leptolyngbyaceae bacterium]